jgi:hypothetical protein
VGERTVEYEDYRNLNVSEDTAEFLKAELPEEETEARTAEGVCR